MFYPTSHIVDWTTFGASLSGGQNSYGTMTISTIPSGVSGRIFGIFSGRSTVSGDNQFTLTFSGTGVTSVQAGATYTTPGYSNATVFASAIIAKGHGNITMTPFTSQGRDQGSLLWFFIPDKI